MRVQIRCLLVCLLLLGSISKAWAQDNDISAQKNSNFLVYACVSGFTWAEYEQGIRLLKESGPLYGLGLQASGPLSKDIRAHTKVELFGGKVDYDGQTWGGDPVRTKVSYLGYKIEGSLGLPFWLTPRSSIEPFLGLGIRSWLRDLDSTAEAIGYSEIWTSFYGLLGVYARHKSSQSVTFFGEGALKIAIYNYQKIDILGEKITLEPGQRISFYAEAGILYQRWQVAAFYEGLRFGRSDLEYSALGYVYQPKSEGDLWGFYAGIVF